MEFETEALIFLTEREAEHAFLYIEKRLMILSISINVKTGLPAM